jgi:ADP-ribose pyrophosphatase YjhB (NUDIX family)
MEVCVNVCILKGDSILMVEENKPYVHGLLNIPGGHLEEGENVLEGAMREVLEETGLKVQITGLVAVFNAIMQKKGGHYYEKEILCNPASAMGNPCQHGCCCD